MSIPLAYETRPGDNVTPPVETVCLITHDQHQLYVAFRATDPEPEKIRARLADRDRAFSDDFVGVALDTFNDQRRGFEFFVNPLGVQMDLYHGRRQQQRRQLLGRPTPFQKGVRLRILL